MFWTKGTLKLVKSQGLKPPHFGIGLISHGPMVVKASPKTEQGLAAPKSACDKNLARSLRLGAHESATKKPKDARTRELKRVANAAL